MPTIFTKTNRVAVDEPDEGDTHVQVVWFGSSQDGKHRKVFEGPVEPIENYEAAVAWAVEMADQMVQPLYVVPLNELDVLQTEQAQRGLQSMDGQQRGAMRRQIVDMLAEIMRDSDAADVRAEAYAVLVRLRAIQP